MWGLPRRACRAGLAVSASDLRRELPGDDGSASRSANKLGETLGAASGNILKFAFELKNMVCHIFFGAESKARGCAKYNPTQGSTIWDHFVDQPKQRMKGHSALLAYLTSGPTFVTLHP